MLASWAQARDKLRNLRVVRARMGETAIGMLCRGLRTVVGHQALEALESGKPASAAIDRADERSLRDPGGVQKGFLAGTARHTRDDDVGAADRRLGIFRKYRL